MRKNHFPGWARPFEFNAALYSSINRHEEARDGVGFSYENQQLCVSKGIAIESRLIPTCQDWKLTRCETLICPLG